MNQATFESAVNGIETNLAIKHLAPFLLTNQLLDVLKAIAPLRNACLLEPLWMQLAFSGGHGSDTAFKRLTR